MFQSVSQMCVCVFSPILQKGMSTPPSTSSLASSALDDATEQLQAKADRLLEIRLVYGPKYV